MKDYANFDLSIERSGETYRARVLYAPTGELPSLEFAPPFSRDELRDLIPPQIGPRRDVKARRAKSVQAAFRRAGAKLFRAVFAGDLLACWAAGLTASRGKVLRLRLRLGDPEAAGWPWEYLYDDRLQQWLALSPDISIVRYPEMPEAIAPLAVEIPLRVLVVEAARTGHSPLASRLEWNDIEKGLSGLRARGGVVLERLESASLSALVEKLRRETWHVLHFIGHGGIDDDGDRALVFEKENGGPDPVSGGDLGSLLLGHPDLRLVVLNACDTAREGRSEVFSSVAQALVRSRVPAVVAMQVAVSDRAAVSFARHFYRELAEGSPLDEVLTHTRRWMMGERHGVEWGTPVLYFRSDNGQLFEIEKAEHGEAEPPVLPIPASPSTWKRLAAAVLLLFLLLLSPAIFYLSKKRGHREPPPPDLTRSIVLRNEKSDPECPEPPGVHIPFRLIKPKEGKPFCMGKFEVIQEQWAKVVKGVKHSSAHLGPDLPVEKVTREEADEFNRQLNEVDPEGRYRLPSNEQWSYAAHAGTQTTFEFGDDIKLLSRYGNCLRPDGYPRTAPVGEFKPNRLGLYDMPGNVAEWVEGVAPRGQGIVRGGSWDSPAAGCSAESSEVIKAQAALNTVGFRIVRDPVFVKK